MAYYCCVNPHLENPSRECQNRIVIEGVKPEIDGGRFPIKRVVGDGVRVDVDVFADGHDLLSCLLLYRKEGQAEWTEVPMEMLGNDRWSGQFTVTEVGRYLYTIQAWVARFRTWQQNIEKKVRGGQDVSVDTQVGARLADEASNGAEDAVRERLQRWARALREVDGATEKLLISLDEEVAGLVDRYLDRRSATVYGKELLVVVDPVNARFSAWYEMFPRSWARQAGYHGTFEDVESNLPYIAGMGFDVLYLPPIHPIGRRHRKGKNNISSSGPDDPGSPWAIGSEQGGHKSVHPQLGTLEDFRRLVARAKEFGIEIALDIAFQCSPDHPYVKQHPDWFRWRLDGSVQYAENPPKRYEDIYPFDFDTDRWRDLWEELKSVFLFWIEQGVGIFRVDNPHTKPFPFWEWVIGEIKREHPEVIFLSEAFTRPKVMYYLAKLGFTQSYSYFAWRNTAWDLTQYFTELTQSEVREFFRPSLWPNTPDILTEYLQTGGRPAFMSRLILAATLGSSYGIFGPAFELCLNQPREPGSEEYLDSEKYEVRHWDMQRPGSLRDLITQVNKIRRENPSLQGNESLRFHPLDNDQLIAYSKSTLDLTNVILTVVNLDPHHTQAGWIDLDVTALGLDPDQPYQVHDLLSDDRYLWHGRHNYVEINPQVIPAHIFRVLKRVRSERDFEYYV